MGLWPGRAVERDQYVITEDDYIGYLTQSPVESLIPSESQEVDADLLVVRADDKLRQVRPSAHALTLHRRVPKAQAHVGPPAR